MVLIQDNISRPWFFNFLLNDNNTYGDWDRDALSTLMRELTDVALASFENPELYDEQSHNRIRLPLQAQQ